LPLSQRFHVQIVSP